MLNGNIAVVFGGRSNESEISVITGTMCANVLKCGKTRVLPIYISPCGDFFCGEALFDIANFKCGEPSAARCMVAGGGLHILGRRGKIKQFIPISAAINCCHGGLGEGGGVGGLFACAGIPMAGGDIFSGAAFLNKDITKIVLGGLGVPCLKYYTASSAEDAEAAMAVTGLPAIIKPACLGSSIGIARAESLDEYAAAIEAALCYDGRALCEPYIAWRREINCAAYFAEGEVHISACEEAIPSGGLLTFDDKYSGSGRSVIPADIPAELAERVQNITRTVYSRLNMRGIVRFDYILSGEELYLSEVNTVPGSLAWYLFAPSFKAFCPVLESVIAQSVADFARQSGKLVLKTGILGSLPALACKLK